MPSVKLTSGTMAVELESAEIPIGDLIKEGLAALQQVHEIEARANEARSGKTGMYA